MKEGCKKWRCGRGRGRDEVGGWGERWAGGGEGEVVALSITGPNINCHPPGGDLLIHVFATTSSTVSLLGQRLF